MRNPDCIEKGELFNEMSRLHRIFVGPDGLRSGWSLFLYVVLFALIVFAGARCGRWLHFGELWSQLVRELVVFLAAATLALVMARIERRPWGAYGLPVRGLFSKRFWRGAVWGFAGISLLLISLHETNAFDFGHIVLHGMLIVRFGLFWGAIFLLVGLFEEFFLRGYAQFTLARGIGFWPAAILLSSVFGLSHLRNAGESWAGALAGVMLGLFCCLTLRRTGNLWFAVGFHASWDWGESFFYSVPDSGEIPSGHLLSSTFHGPDWLTGGSVGPEGSILCLAVIAVVCLAFSAAYRPQRQVPSHEL